MRLAHSAIVLVATVGACSPDPRTQTMVVISADDDVRRQARAIRIRVYGGSASEPPSERAGDDLELPIPDWPVTHALIPKNGDPTRRFRIEVTALGMSGELAHARAIAGFASGETRAIEMRLYDDCIGLPGDECPESQTCTTASACAPAEVDLVPFVPTRDAGRLDAGSDAAAAPDSGGDGGARDASLTDAPAVDAGCTTSAECDDGIDCTEDLCEAGGRCRNIPMDGLCPPSGGPCVAAERCIAGLGCMSEYAANGTPCAGGVCWCSGCWLAADCTACMGGSCDCLENDCQTPACDSLDLCTP